MPAIAGITINESEKCFMSKLYAVGFGPGGYEHMTVKAVEAIKEADIVTGYTTYVEMIWSARGTGDELPWSGSG